MKNRVIDGQSQTGQSICLPMVPWMAIASRMAIETVIFIFVDRVVGDKRETFEAIGGYF